MTPAASVCGFYIAHQASTYFSVGKIGDDQVQDLARRRGRFTGRYKSAAGLGAALCAQA
jgi:hypothetical protein